MPKIRRMAERAQRSPRILLVEDFEDTREMYAQMFSRAGYQVVTAANGEEALGRVAGGTFDVVVLDVGLPKVNGLTVIRILRGGPETSRIPIVTVSAAVGAQLHRAILEAGADAVLDKPCLPEELERTVRGCLERHRSTERARLDTAGETATPGQGGRGSHPPADDEPPEAAPACPETGYYVNSRLGLLALIAKGLRLPSGQWVRIADADVEPSRAEEMVPDLFPALKGAFVPCALVLTDFDVAEFERRLPPYAGAAD